MKFAKYLQEEVVPEWRKAYLNYKQGKKYLKAIEAAINKLQTEHVETQIQCLSPVPIEDISAAPPPADPAQPSIALSGPATPEPESEPIEPSVPAYSPHIAPDSPTGTTPIKSRSHVRSYDTMQIPSHPTPLSPTAASAPGKILSDSNSPSGIRTDSMQRRGSLSPLNGSTERRDSIAQQFGDAARAHSSQLIKDFTRRLTTISAPGRVNRPRAIQVEGNSLDSVKDQLLDEEKQFFRFLDEQLTMVNDFYRDKELEAGTKLKVLKQQLYVADEWRRRYDNKIAKAQSDRAWYRNEWSKVRNGIGSLILDSDATQDVTLGHANRAHAQSADGQQNRHIDSSKDMAAGSSTGTRTKRIQELRQRESHGTADERNTKQLPVDPISYQDQLVLEDEENRRQRLNHSVARTRIKTALYEFYRSLEMLKNYKVLNNTGFVKIMKKFDKTAGWKASKAFVASKLRPAYFMSSSTLDDLVEETENLFIEKFENGQRRRGMAKLRIPDTKNQATRVGLYLGVTIPLFVLGIQGALSTETQARIPYWDSLLLIYGGLFLPILFSCLFGVNMYAWAKSRINYKFIFEFDPRDNLDFHEFFELPALFMLILTLTLYFEFASSWTEYVAIGYYPLVAICVIFAILFCPLPIANWGARRWFLQSMSRILISGYYRVEFRDFFLADELNSLTYSIEQFEFAICAYSHDWESVAQTCTTSKFWLTPFITALPAWFRFLQCLRRFRDTFEWFPHLINAGKYFSSLTQLFVYFSYRHSATTPLKVAYIVVSTLTSAYTYTWDIYMDWGLFRFGKHGGGAYGHPFLRPELVYPRTWVAIKDIPLPFHIHVEGESDEEDEDAGIEGDNNDALKSGSVTFGEGSQMVIAEGSSLDSNAAASATATQRKQSPVRSPSANGGAISRLSSPAGASQISLHSTTSSGRPGIKSRPSQSSIATYGLRRSTAFVDNAMTEAGFGDDRREQLSAANKFYDRRDFDSKIEGAAEGLFRIRRRSTVSMPPQTGLGVDTQGVGTNPDGVMGNTPRRSIKNSIFGRRPNTDEDDTDTDEA
ncbi:hypothetical protein BGX26_010052 [Mortierella sp. AD094]|nr:hypothetical protein BGX26_010052 [Mortierella sp. AD094]